MSNNENKVLKRKKIIDLLNNSKKIEILFLSILIISGLIIRLVFLPFDLVLNNDAAAYFWYASDVSILGKMPTEISSHLDSQFPNNGWPIFLSIFFSVTDSNNFLDYMNIQRVISVIISGLTIIPMYFLARKFFNKSYALIAGVFFVFEPRLIENSLLGITEPLYLFLGTTILCFFLSKKQEFILISFALAALFSMIRYEGLLIVIPLTIMYFFRYHKNKKEILTYFLAIMIFIIIILPMGILRMESTDSDGLSSHVIAGGEFYSKTIDEEGSSIIQELIFKGTEFLGKYFVLISIPLFIICLPYGIFRLIKNKDEKKWTLILFGLIFLIPAFYAYSRGFQDTRYIFIYYPILSLISIYFIQLIEKKIGRPNFVFIFSIILIIIISTIFLNFSINNYEIEKEQYEISLIINKISTSVNRDFNSVPYLKWSDYDVRNNYPILSTDVQQKDIVKIIKIGNTSKNEFSNLEEYFSFAKKQKLTHLVLDNNNMNNKFLQNIFQNEENYKFLKKIYDSRDDGYNYHVKVFEINYDVIKFN